LASPGGSRRGIFAEIDFNLHDPNEDGKIRLHGAGEELPQPGGVRRRRSEAAGAARRVRRAGEIFAKLFAFLKINLGFFTLDKESTSAGHHAGDFNIRHPVPTLANELPAVCCSSTWRQRRLRWRRRP